MAAAVHRPFALLLLAIVLCFLPCVQACEERDRSNFKTLWEGQPSRRDLPRRLLLDDGGGGTAAASAAAVASAASTASTADAADSSPAASATTSIKKCLWSDAGGGCALNPSVMFSLKEAPDSYERVLLQITAMRYRCLAHASGDACAKDVRGWCAWDAGACALRFDDADFAGLLLWSAVSLACDGSPLADVVRCSFELYSA